MEPIAIEALHLHLLRSLFLHFEVESSGTIDNGKAKMCRDGGRGEGIRHEGEEDSLLAMVARSVETEAKEKEYDVRGKEYDVRGKGTRRLNGVDSDFAPFVQHAGVPSD
ncbi:hypothetical protein JHK85_010192 [Glycine max]|nr:hypothetical protein JHK85_010192 [Glycine max]